MATFIEKIDYILQLVEHIWSDVGLAPSLPVGPKCEICPNQEENFLLALLPRERWLKHLPEILLGEGMASHQVSNLKQ